MGKSKEEIIQQIEAKEANSINAKFVVDSISDASELTQEDKREVILASLNHVSDDSIKPEWFQQFLNIAGLNIDIKFIIISQLLGKIPTQNFDFEDFSSLECLKQFKSSQKTPIILAAIMKQGETLDLDSVISFLKAHDLEESEKYTIALSAINTVDAKKISGDKLKEFLQLTFFTPEHACLFIQTTLQRMEPDTIKSGLIDDLLNIESLSLQHKERIIVASINRMLPEEITQDWLLSLLNNHDFTPSQKLKIAEKFIEKIKKGTVDLACIEKIIEILQQQPKHRSSKEKKRATKNNMLLLCAYLEKMAKDKVDREHVDNLLKIKEFTKLEYKSSILCSVLPNLSSSVITTEWLFKLLAMKGLTTSQRQNILDAALEGIGKGNVKCNFVEDLLAIKPKKKLLNSAISKSEIKDFVCAALKYMRSENPQAKEEISLEWLAGILENPIISSTDTSAVLRAAIQGMLPETLNETTLERLLGMKGFHSRSIPGILGAFLENQTTQKMNSELFKEFITKFTKERELHINNKLVLINFAITGLSKHNDATFEDIKNFITSFKDWYEQKPSTSRYYVSDLNKLKLRTIVAAYEAYSRINERNKKSQHQQEQREQLVNIIKELNLDANDESYKGSVALVLNHLHLDDEDLIKLVELLTDSTVIAQNSENAAMRRAIIYRNIILRRSGMHPNSNLSNKGHPKPKKVNKELLVKMIKSIGDDSDALAKIFYSIQNKEEFLEAAKEFDFLKNKPIHLGNDAFRQFVREKIGFGYLEEYLMLKKGTLESVTTSTLYVLVLIAASDIKWINAMLQLQMTNNTRAFFTREEYNHIKNFLTQKHAQQLPTYKKLCEKILDESSSTKDSEEYKNAVERSNEDYGINFEGIKEVNEAKKEAVDTAFRKILSYQPNAFSLRKGKALIKKFLNATGALYGFDANDSFTKTISEENILKITKVFIARKNDLKYLFSQPGTLEAIILATSQTGAGCVANYGHAVDLLIQKKMMRSYSKHKLYSVLEKMFFAINHAAAGDILGGSAAVNFLKAPVLENAIINPVGLVNALAKEIENSDFLIPDNAEQDLRNEFPLFFKAYDANIMSLMQPIDEGKDKILLALEILRATMEPSEYQVVEAVYFAHIEKTMDAQDVEIIKHFVDGASLDDAFLNEAVSAIKNCLKTLGLTVEDLKKIESQEERDTVNEITDKDENELAHIKALIKPHLENIPTKANDETEEDRLKAGKAAMQTLLEKCVDTGEEVVNEKLKTLDSEVDQVQKDSILQLNENLHNYYAALKRKASSQAAR